MLKKAHFFNLLYLGIFFLVALGMVSEGKAEPISGPCFEKLRALNVTLENDLFGGGADKHFTHGTRLSYVELKKKVTNKSKCNELGSNFEIEPTKSWFHRMISDEGFGAKGVSFILGQNIFTPENITTPSLIIDDRPYAGWLYFGIGLVKQENTSYGASFVSLEVDLGVVGPLSFADDAQLRVHKIIDSPRPRGWNNQLDNEPGILINLELKWLFEQLQPWKQGLELDILPSVGTAAGNVMNYFSAGATLRLGVNLPKDYGPPRIRPGAQGSDFFIPGEGDRLVSWYLFAGLEGRAVIHNIFLDGNTFATSHSVDKKYFVGDLHLGFVLVISQFRIAFSNVFRTEEFNNQKELDEFGSITVSWAW